MSNSSDKNQSSSQPTAGGKEQDKNYQSTQKSAQQQEQPSQGQKNQETAKLEAPGMPEIKMPQAPGIELPKGGGALQGIGEKFTANPATGTASFSVPIAMSPGRNGFGPQLSLSYDSGAGNSPFGLGWNVGVAAIMRKTQKELPQYMDSKESDTFILSGAEDLVPLLKEDAGNWLSEDYTSGSYEVKRYRPRTEGLWARIERWLDTTTGISHWKTISKDNMTTIYGESAACRVADPNDSKKIFKWLIEKSYDEKGNVLVYEYKKENTDGLDGTQIQEVNRLKNNSAFNQLYLKRVYYGNTVMYNDANFDSNNEWLFQLVLDYGEHPGTSPALAESQDWHLRNDAFSTYRAGFEIRTYRRCERILQFHNFTELDTVPVLVKETKINYNALPQGNQVQSVQHIAHQSGETPAAMPAVEFQYTQAERDETLRDFSLDDLENLPGGVDGQSYTWTDLEGEGVSGVLIEQARGWYYKRNLGDRAYYNDYPVATPPEPDIKMGHLEQVAERPNLGAMQQLGDLNGDGLNELLVQGQGYTGYFEMNEEGGWKRFKTIDNYPNINFQNPNLKRIDLNGDGIADLFISEDNCFRYYPSEQELQEGYVAAREIAKPSDEAEGPAIIFADASQSIYTADMSGDGLTDIVRVRNGEVCYWPNMGHGRFGAKVTMHASPLFDYVDQFEQSRVKLADVDGTGTTDIVYLGTNKVHYWQNQSGNEFSLEDEILNFPKTDRLSAVSVMDLFGKGTSCLVWSSPLANNEGIQIRYIDLMKQKPYLLKEINNNMGMLQRMHYTSSSKFYQRDRFEGKPWITKLPFPVQVLERNEIFDEITEARFVSRYAYHHGYFDRHEKEFRGFGMVEQWDSEQYEAFGSSGLFQVGSNLLDEASHTPPVYSKTWFHNGYYEAKGKISQQYAAEYYHGDTDAFEMPDSTLPNGLTAAETREALRIMRGQTLRAEVYADDATAESNKPYAVTETNYRIKKVQPKQGNKHAVFFTVANETLSYQYERDETDPRIAHQMVLETDNYGMVTKAAAVAYPRRGTGHETEQMATHISYSEADYIHEDDNANFYRLGIAYQSKGYEITGVAGSSKIVPTTLASQIASASSINYEDSPSSGTEKRLIAWQKMYFYNEALSASLSLGSVASHAIPYRALNLALTPGLITEAYNNDATIRVTESMLLTEGKYIKEDNLYWIPSGIMTFDDSHFFTLSQSTDPFGNSSTFSYDSFYLFATTITDALSNSITMAIDYRLLAPWQTTDINGNRQQVAFDVRGMVTKMAQMGKSGQSLGDTLSDPTVKLTYDLFNWQNNQEPNYAKVEARIEHGNPSSDWQTSYEYTGGLGEVLLVKVQAEAGDAVQHNGAGELIVDGNGDPILAATSNRWVGNGRTIINNKGLPIKQYEPYFSDTSDFEDEDEVRQYGVSPLLHYDSMGRNVRTDMPDGTFTKVEFTPWWVKHYDAVDTVKDSQWYIDRGSPDPDSDPEPSDEDERAAWHAAKHHYTPQMQVMDNIGRPFLTRDHNGFDSGSPVYYDVRVEMDIQGKKRTVTNPLSQDTVFMHSVLPLNDEGAGQVIYTNSPDGGWRRALLNVQGQPIKSWDERGHEFTHIYDELRRPVEVIVDEGSGDKLINFMVYGDNAGITSPEDDNLKGQLIRAFDQSGVNRIIEIDFKGNPLSSEREFATNYKTTIDWSGLTALTTLSSIDSTSSSSLEGETFSSSLEYDALNRPTTITRPDSSKILPTYNEAGMLESVEVKIRGAGSATTFISDINYNEKGQRTKIVYGNGARTKFTYDPNNFRLTRILSTRNSGANILQDLNYTFDPVGNITEMRDNALQTHYFQNSVVSPNGKYEYDALYRLTRSTGREHYGQAQISHNDFSINTAVPQNNNANAVENYTEAYEYDEIGNILKLIHQATSGNWTRGYYYDSSTSNYLLKTSLPGDTVSDSNTYSASYTHDTHGNMTSMPHLSSMIWDFHDQLREVDLGGGGTAWYVYDAQGTRVRKVIENGTLKKDRIYLDEINEYYREYISGSKDYERETLHVMDDRKRLAVVETKTWDAGSAVVTPSPVIRYQFDNHLGSASLELDTSAAIISYEEYHPFGTSAYRLGSSVSEVSLKRYRYVGKERDDESGLYYYGARYYAAWLCRFVSVDPLKDDYPYYTPFQYAGNKPISYIDLDGLEETKPYQPTSTKRLEINRNSFTGTSKERRSVRKYGRKFESEMNSLKSQSSNSSKDNSSLESEAHNNLFEKLGDKKWMWIKNKKNVNQGNSHSGFFNAGALFKWYESTDSDRREKNTISKPGGKLESLNPAPGFDIRTSYYDTHLEPKAIGGSASFTFESIDSSSVQGDTKFEIYQSKIPIDPHPKSGKKLGEITIPVTQKDELTVEFDIKDGRYLSVVSSGEGMGILGNEVTSIIETDGFRPFMYVLSDGQSGNNGLTSDRIDKLNLAHKTTLENTHNEKEEKDKRSSKNYSFYHEIYTSYGF